MIATVVFLINGNNILLAKKTKKIGVGMWNGYGGKQDGDETITECAVRELYEETGKDLGNGIIVKEEDLEECATIDFDNGTENVNFTVKFFIARKFEGEVVQTHEMAEPTWFDIGDEEKMREVYANMLPADVIFVPMILRGEKFTGEVHFSEDMKSVVSSEFKPIII